MRSIVLAVVVSSLSSPAFAQSARPQTPPVSNAEAYKWIHISGGVTEATRRGVTIPLWDSESKDGESLDSFVTRTGRDALRVLSSSPATICGQLEETPGKYKILLKATSKAADCSAQGSRLPYMHIRRTEAGVKSVGPSPSELRGPVYVVDLSGINFEDGRKTRPVVDFGKK
ncbi:hypothetical protein EN794_004820 [Mesorhizobium sp. M00.F.Ca.ET.151.01.1.1]|nr:hypothetical protein EN842_05475 [bacterium M00.F.Ca.ET.199.01.1.1]TGT08790.1 hypothetical protein EN820_00660 [bacterium M00.F.Ca.ET.177.01.1.1]TGT66724.1 hypothetical protein EN813_000660 [Mesorhizobium sp. M00.F.Ca.ET.170.01.1.1]TGU98363.1 hypothetical protein EN794_004820 [Mesorhizobium sp. M00.F.Ca.ET.151.01.1.1]TGV60028.1 hypothetical protein EN784_06210 [bacterium M00.F.Ca.ET.141.01.1.1]